MLLNCKRFDSTVKTLEGCTALAAAIMAGAELRIIDLIVTVKPSLISQRSNEEITPLHEAAKIRRLDIVKTLISHGANVNDFDLDLENCLHCAASNTDYEMIEYLLNETEVDPQAKNRDEMNPLCLLLVRSSSNVEPRDLVSRCFFLMLEKTYEMDPFTNNYLISDIFQCAFLASVYSHTEIVKYLIHNVYNVNNSKYAFIRKLSENCNGNNTEYLYYMLVFLHDEIDTYDKYSFPRFSEINYFLGIRSIIYIMDQLLPTDNAVELILQTLEQMNNIGFNIQVKEFEDQIGVLLFEKYSSKATPLMSKEDIEKIDQILRFLLLKGFKLNSMTRSFLHSIAIAKETEIVSIDSSLSILKIFLHYATTFFVDLETWKQINDLKNFNSHIQQIVQWLVNNFGNLRLNAFLDMSCVYPLKHICRNQIREQLKYDPNLLCNSENLAAVGLPELLLNYVMFRD